LGIISQSGSMTQRLTEYAFSLGVGTDKAVSVGNGTVLGSLDFLEFMGDDDGIRVLAMYIEGMQDGEKFFQLCGGISKRKPIVVWEGGESEAGCPSLNAPLSLPHLAHAGLKQRDAPL
jgi:acyl-CoA synthetase (NDP forming)